MSTPSCSTELFSMIAAIASSIAAAASAFIAWFTYRQNKPRLELKLSLRSMMYLSNEPQEKNCFIYIEILNPTNIGVYLNNSGLTLSNPKMNEKYMIFNDEIIAMINDKQLLPTQSLNIPIQIFGKKDSGIEIPKDKCLKFLETFIKHENYSVFSSLGREYFASKKNSKSFRNEIKKFKEELKANENK
ncbi:hypothetical protein [Fluviispira multicolorata]|uniref:Uncharacterized protein n=1 Tax=Fluviispira multicolorata TaxID=2654512 RepID=A0A833JF92_9BACT|nr:hypothetical protein [Fluviispira multicolorata]KAB8033606.1 hypothetical protein GCL57_02545 [Fluviispira multicolorata]